MKISLDFFLEILIITFFVFFQQMLIMGILKNLQKSCFFKMLIIPSKKQKFNFFFCSLGSAWFNLDMKKKIVEKYYSDPKL